MNIKKYLLEPNETWRHFFKEWGLFQWKAFVYALAILGILSIAKIIIW